MWRAVARLVLRPQQSVRERILSQWLPHAGLSTQELVSGSYAALHIRRGDKGSEARLRPTCDYAKALARLLARRRLPQPAALFVATDGPEVLDELRACASFGGGSRGKRPHLHTLIELAGIPTRGMSDASFARIWTEVEILWWWLAHLAATSGGWCAPGAPSPHCHSLDSHRAAARRCRSSGRGPQTPFSRSMGPSPPRSRESTRRRRRRSSAAGPPLASTRRASSPRQGCGDGGGEGGRGAENATHSRV